MNAHERGTTRIEDERHGLERVFDNALQEAEACAGYALDAEAAGDDRLWPASFGRCVRRTRASPSEPRACSAGEMTGCRWSVFRRAGPRPKGIRATFRRTRTACKR